MHLAKLEQAGFLATDFRRGSRRGPAGEAVPSQRHRRHLRLPAAPLRAALRLGAGRARRPATRGTRACACCREGRGRDGAAGHWRGEASARAARPLAAELVRARGRRAGPAARGRMGRRRLRVAVSNCAFRELCGGDPELVVRHASRVLRGPHRGRDRRARAAAHRVRRPSHELRRRALRAAVHVLAGTVSGAASAVGRDTVASTRRWRGR